MGGLELKSEDQGLSVPARPLPPLLTSPVRRLAEFMSREVWTYFKRAGTRIAHVKENSRVVYRSCRSRFGAELKSGAWTADTATGVQSIDAPISQVSHSISF